MTVDGIGVAVLDECLDGALRKVRVPTLPNKGVPTREKFGFSKSNANPGWASPRRSGIRDRVRSDGSRYSPVGRSRVDKFRHEDYPARMRARLGQQATRIRALEREAPHGRLQRSKNGRAE